MQHDDGRSPGEGISSVTGGREFHGYRVAGHRPCSLAYGEDPVIGISRAVARADSTSTRSGKRMPVTHALSARTGGTGRCPVE